MFRLDLFLFLKWPYDPVMNTRLTWISSVSMAGGPQRCSLVSSYSWMKLGCAPQVAFGCHCPSELSPMPQLASADLSLQCWDYRFKPPHSASWPLLRDGSVAYVLLHCHETISTIILRNLFILQNWNFITITKLSQSLETATLLPICVDLTSVWTLDMWNLLALSWLAYFT